MKKVIASILLFVCIAVFIFSCYKSINSDISLDFSFDEYGNYVGFSNLPINYTMEAAKEDGYYVTQDSEVIANKKVWDNFVKNSLRRVNTDIRMVAFYTERSTDSPYFTDLFFEDGYYYLFDSTAENQEMQPYLYLLTLTGKWGNPVKNSSIIVISNDNTLTYDTVISVMISSNMSLKESISPFRIIMFK